MKKNIILFFFIATFSTTQVFADNLKGKFELASSKIDYLVTYLIKKADGASTAAKGKGECDKACEFLVAVALKSFESKDANRDANMLKVTKADKFPLAVAHINFPADITSRTLKSDMEIELGGIKHLYKDVPLTINFNGETFHAEGKVDLLLSLHHIERPSLIGVEIKDLVPITISADWKKTN